MSNKERRVSALTAIILAVIMYFIDFRISTGIILGYLASIFHLYLITISMDNMLKSGRVNMFIVMLGSMLRYVIIAFPLVIALILPQYFNIFGAAGGFILYKVVLIAFAVFYKD